MYNIINTTPLINLVKDKFNCNVLTCDPVGSGAVGKVYKVTIDKPPLVVAVKMSSNSALLMQEYNYINYISDRVDIKLPKLYFIHTSDNPADMNFLCMEYFNGISANNSKFLWKSRKIKGNFRNQVIANLTKIQTVTNDKFGSIDNAIYSDWHDYYRPFAKYVMDFTNQSVIDGKFLKQVASVMQVAYDNYDRIFDEPISSPTLTHGDYWMPNLIVDAKSMNLLGIVDPFNVIWADRDYELFTLVAGLGNKFKIYKEYKKIHNISQKCDLKIEFYALFSEVYWFTLTNHKYDNFMIYKAKLLNKQMRRFGIINK